MRRARVPSERDAKRRYVVWESPAQYAQCFPTGILTHRVQIE